MSVDEILLPNMIDDVTDVPDAKRNSNFFSEELKYWRTYSTRRLLFLNDLSD